MVDKKKNGERRDIAMYGIRQNAQRAAYNKTFEEQAYGKMFEGRLRGFLFHIKFL